MCKTKVPSPWTAVEANENSLGCAVKVWGREYKFENNLLFSSVTSLGEELLSSPVRISASENGNKIEWQDINTFLSEFSDQKAVIYTTAQSEAFIVNVCAAVEFDGFVTADIKLMPRGYTVPQLFGLEKKDPPKTYLDYFHIEIPIKNKFAKLYHHYPNDVMPDSTGDTAKSDMYSGSGFLNNEVRNCGFSAVEFLGNDEKGFFVYAESNRNWQTESPAKSIQLLPAQDETVIRLRLIDGMPKAWADIDCKHGQYEYPDICFRLAFEASPVKPFPENPYTEKRLHIDCFKKIPQDYMDFLSNPVVEGSNEIGYDRIERLGVTTLVIHEKWNQVQNYWKLTKRTENQLKTIIEECHKRNIKVVPYFGYEISTLADIWYDKSELYRRKCDDMGKGLGWYRFPAQREMCVCYNSPIADEFANGLEKLVDEYDFDGVYLDGTGMVWGCNNTAHGCGYIDAEGKIKQTYPIFGVRNLFKKLYEIFESRGKTINCHVSDCICPAGIGFAHSLWLGEYIQYGLVKNGADSMPEGYLRSTHSGRNIGIPAEFIVYENKPIWGFEDALAFSLVHGVLPRPNDIGEPLEKMSKIWKIIDSFPISKSKWCPYFEIDDVPFKCDELKIKISGYKFSEDKKEKWLLFVANSQTNEVEKCHISGFNNFGRITDALTGENVNDENGIITLTVKRFQSYIFIAEK